MHATYYLNTLAAHVPKTMTKDFRLTLTLADGKQKTIDVIGSHQRLVRVPLSENVTAIRFEPVSTWGNQEAHVFSFDVE
jgi:hypothetical protein